DVIARGATFDFGARGAERLDRHVLHHELVDLIEMLGDHLDEGVTLVREVAVEGADAHSGLARDVRSLRSVVALPLEHVARRFDQGAVGGARSLLREHSRVPRGGRYGAAVSR